MLATPSSGSLYKRTQKKEAFAMCLLALTLCGEFNSPVAQSFAGIGTYFFRITT